MISAVLSAAGGVAWCALFGEYLLHRFVFHGTVGRLVLFWHPALTEHIRHHRGPFFSPFWIKACIVVPLLLLCSWLAARWLFFVGDPLCFAAGLTGYYALFEALHWTMHVSAPSTWLGLKLRQVHFMHHFSRVDSNFGFFGGIVFDWLVFGTLADPEHVRIPKGYAIPWLHDGKTIKAEYQTMFTLR